MSEFSYKAVGADGKLVSGIMTAEDRQSVIESLRASGHLPVRVEPKGTATEGLRRYGSWINFRGRISRREVTVLTRELATLLNAGLPLDSSLRILEKHTSDEALAGVIGDIRAAVREGKSLSAALTGQPALFDAIYVNQIRAAEASGTLATVLLRLADYRERSEAFHASVVASLAYPAILVVVACVSLFTLMSFVVPRFVPLFDDAGTTLPVLTKIVFGAAGFLQHTWWLILLLLICVGLGLQHWLVAPNNQRRFDAWVLRLPGLGQILLFTETARFTRVLGSLLENGLPLVASLKLASQVTKNSAIAAMLSRCRESIEQGGRFADALDGETLLPRLAHELVAVGEESGRLEYMLLKAAETLETRAQDRLRRALTLLEPVLILGLGAVIALVIVAILLAMLGLNDLV